MIKNIKNLICKMTGKANLPKLFLGFTIFLTVFFVNTNLRADEIIQSKRPVGKPLLRYNDFIEMRFDSSDTEREPRIKAINQLAEMQKLSKKYYEELQSSIPDWKNIGPFNIGGRVRSIAVHPTNPDIVYIGAAAGGIWKSINGGTNWTPIFDFENATSFGSLAIDPNNPDIIYAATGEMIIGGGIPYLGNGIYKSTDAGKSWFQIGLTEVAAFSKIYVHPQNSNLIYAGGAIRNGGVYRSTNGGNDWEKLFDGNITDLCLNPNKQNEVYAGVNIQGVIFTSDGGKTWENRSQGLTNLGGRVSVQAFTGNFQILFALIERKDSRGAIFKSVDGGKSWSLMYDGNSSFFNSQGYYNNFISINPTNSFHVLAGGIELWQSHYGGYNWTNLSNSNNIHVDQHHAVFAPSQPNIIYLANDGGIYKSTNSGQNWKDMNKGLMITQFYAFTIDNKQLNRNFGGTQDHGTVGNPSNNWKMVVGGDGFDCFMHPNDPNIVFGEIYYGDVFKYNIKTDKYTFLRSGLPEDDIGAWHSPFIFDERTHTMYLGRNTLYVSYNYGEFFFQFSPRYNHQFTAIGVSRKNSRVMYAGNRVGQIIATTNAGITWEDINTSSLPGKYITDIQTSAIDEGTVYVTFSGYGSRHIFKSDDYGKTWNAIDLAMPDVPVNSISLHPENESIIFVGTDIGVFLSHNGGDDWMPYGQNLPRTPILDLKFHTNRILLPKLTLRAATHGRSIWEIEVPDDLVHDPVILSPSGIENYIGASFTNTSWFGFEYPVRVEFSPATGVDFSLFKDSVYTNLINFQLPDISTFTARIRVTSLKNGDQRESRTFSIHPKYKGAVLYQTSLGYNTYGLASAQGGRLWVVDYRNGFINLYDTKDFSLLKKIESPVKGIYTDVTINQGLDSLFLHKMDDENGKGAEIVVLDTNGNLLARTPSPANYPMGLAYYDGNLYCSERDGQKRIFKFEPQNNFKYSVVMTNPVTSEFGPRCMTSNNDLIHQISTYFNNNSLTKADITVFRLNSQNIIETITLVERNGIMNARGIDTDPSDGNYWVSNFTGSIFKIAAGDNVTSVNYDLEKGIIIFPNPAGDFITIQFSKGLKPYVTDDSPSNKELQLFAAEDKVQIFDVLGLEVGQSSLIDNTTHNNSQSGMIDLLRIDVSHLPAGVYFIRFGNKVEKFVKI